MRLNVRAKLVAAKKHVAAKERVAFTLEIKVLRQPIHLVTVVLHPLGKERLFPGAFLVAEITRDEFAADSQPGIGGENHIGQSRLRRDQMNLAIQFGKRRMQLLPLFLGDLRFSATGDAHPGIDLVLDAVVVRRTKKQLAHKIDTYLLTLDSLRQSASSRRNGSTSVTRPMDCNGCCSTTRSTAEASMSTHTIFTVGASMLATASECRIVANNNACVTSASFSRNTFCPSMASVVAPGISPSSRIEPVRTTSTSRWTHAWMIPVVRTFFSTAAAMPPASRMALIARIRFSRPPRANASSRLMPKEVPNNARSTS